MELIDEFGIFQEIKEIVQKDNKERLCFAFGSRVKGYSHDNTKKYDFDLSVSNINENEVRELKENLSKHFEGRVDENNNKIKIDIFRTTINNFNEFKKRIGHGKLL